MSFSRVQLRRNRERKRINKLKWVKGHVSLLSCDSQFCFCMNVQKSARVATGAWVWRISVIHTGAFKIMTWISKKTLSNYSSWIWREEKNRTENAKSCMHIKWKWIFDTECRTVDKTKNIFYIKFIRLVKFLCGIVKSGWQKRKSFAIMLLHLMAERDVSQL